MCRKNKIAYPIYFKHVTLTFKYNFENKKAKHQDYHYTRIHRSTDLDIYDTKYLSGSLPKTGPFIFASENQFP